MWSPVTRPTPFTLLHLSLSADNVGRSDHRVYMAIETAPAIPPVTPAETILRSIRLLSNRLDLRPLPEWSDAPRPDPHGGAVVSTTPRVSRPPRPPPALSQLKPADGVSALKDRERLREAEQVAEIVVGLELEQPLAVRAVIGVLPVLEVPVREVGEDAARRGTMDGPRKRWPSAARSPVQRRSRPS